MGLDSYVSSYALPLKRSNLIGQLGTARILQRNGTNTGIRVIPMQLSAEAIVGPRPPCIYMARYREPIMMQCVIIVYEPSSRYCNAPVDMIAVTSQQKWPDHRPSNNLNRLLQLLKISFISQCVDSIREGLQRLVAAKTYSFEVCLKDCCNGLLQVYCMWLNILLSWKIETTLLEPCSAF